MITISLNMNHFFFFIDLRNNAVTRVSQLYMQIFNGRRYLSIFLSPNQSIAQGCFIVEPAHKSKLRCCRYKNTDTVGIPQMSASSAKL